MATRVPTHSRLTAGSCRPTRFSCGASPPGPSRAEADRPLKLAQVLEEKSRRLFGRSLKLRQVSAAGCNACEAELNVLISGGTGPYDNRDIEHDQSWANYVTPVLLLTDTKAKRKAFVEEDEEETYSTLMTSMTLNSRRRHRQSRQ